MLAHHDNDLKALVALSCDVSEDEVVEKRFRLRNIFDSSVLPSLLVSLVLMILLQCSGHGAVTFYTVQMLKVSFNSYLKATALPL